MYRCVLDNDEGQGTAGRIVRGDDKAVKIHALREPTYFNDTLELSCWGDFDQVVLLSWRLIKPTGRSIPIQNDTGITITQSYKNDDVPSFDKYFGDYYKKMIKHRSVHDARSFLHISSLTDEYQGRYVCGCGGSVGLGVCLNEKAYQTPELKTRLPPRVLQLTKRPQLSKIILDCQFEGDPEPKIVWMIDKLPVNSSETTELKENGRVSLVLDRNHGANNLSDDALITCKAQQNILEHSVTKTLVNIQTQQAEPIPTPFGWIFFVEVCLISVSFFVGLLVFFRWRRYKNDHRLGFSSHRPSERENLGYAFWNNAEYSNLMDELNSNSPLEDCPFFSQLSFPIDRIQLGEAIGKGAFGQVVKATAIGIERDGRVKTVAVKMARDERDEEQKKALISEVNICTSTNKKLIFKLISFHPKVKTLAYLGKQINIVNLLGVVTKNNKLMVIVEYCEMGSLKDFLIDCRESFENQVDEKHGEINWNPDNLNAEAERYVKVPAFGAVELYRAAQSKLDTRDLLHFAFQIGRGMQYIHSKKVTNSAMRGFNLISS